MKLTPLATVEQLYHGDHHTGDRTLDAVMDTIIKTTTHSAQDVADLLGVDKRKLSNAIDLLTGEPLEEMIMDWRAYQMRDLLRDTDLPLQEVARRCGYRETSSLIVFFRRRFGVTPLAFRTGRISRHSEYLVNDPANGRRKAMEIIRKLQEEDK